VRKELWSVRGVVQEVLYYLREDDEPHGAAYKFFRRVADERMFFAESKLPMSD
jgi:hypothetical protein